MSGVALDPIPCGELDPSTTVCTGRSMPSTAKAVAGTFSVLSTDLTRPDAMSYPTREVAQSFRVPSRGRPGSVTVLLRLVSDTNLTTTDWDLTVDLVDLGVAQDGVLSHIPLSASICAGPFPAIARGRYNTKLLTIGLDLASRIAFTSPSDVFLVPEHEYAVVFRMEPPGINLVGIASNDQTQDWYVEGHAAVRQARLIAIDPTTHAPCFSNPPFVTDASRDMNMMLTLGDGCTIGETTSCGRGSCARTIPTCDAYGNLNQCRPNLCTTDADCVPDPAHPERGTYPGAFCDNPTGLDYLGTCPSQPETCNGVDDDCNGSTDDGLDVACTPPVP